MHKIKEKYRKYMPTQVKQQTFGKYNDSLQPSQCNTVQSAYSYVPKVKQTITGSSSRIANEVQPFDSHYNDFRSQILKKVQVIESQSNNRLEKKERELYFMRIQLQNNQVRLIEAEEALARKDQQIQSLKYQLNRGKGYSKGTNKEQSNYLIEQNLKLKQSLDVLIAEKNSNFRHSSQLKINQKHNLQTEKLKNEVEELKNMVAELEKIIHNCPSCYTLDRNLQELNESYACLLKQHTKLKQFSQSQEQQHMKNMNKHIQENQNILRQNNHLRSQNKYYLRPKRQKLNESVAKRCRTLTDQF